MKRKNPTLLAQQGRQWGAECNTSKRARTSAPSRLSGKTIPLLESPMPSSATSSTDLQVRTQQFWSQGDPSLTHFVVRLASRECQNAIASIETSVSNTQKSCHSRSLPP
jgi:hypothetical protein